MADKWRSKYVNTEIEAILDKANKRPFYILYDEEQSLYRFFPSAEDAQTWLDARAEGVISEEVNALQFAEPITAPAPFKLNLTGLVNNKVFLYGSTDCNLEFDFETVEGSGSSTIEEGIDVYYTIESADNTINKTQSYDSGEHVSFNLSEYLSIGPNTITIHAVGRTTKATRTTVVTYRTIELSLISDIADRSKRNNYQTGANIGISYTAESQEQKTVYCYIDGELYKQVKLNAGKINGTFSIAGLGAGKHLVQLYAEVVSGEDYFRTDVITSEIVIYGEIVDGTSVYISAVMLSASFPYSQGIIDPEVSFPVLNLERFMAFKLNWEYYSQSNIYDTATIKWVLESAGEQEDAPEDAVITMMNASTSGVRPEAISITPVNTGTFLLKAYRYDPYDETYESEPLCEYAMYVSENSHGIKDVTEGLELKLSASGRKNSEDASIRDKWTYNNGSRVISTTFSDMLWTDRSGWSKDALVLNGGATAEIDIKPLSSQILNINEQGCTIEIEFETFNVDNYDVPVVQIRNSQNGENEPVFKIYADSARIKSGATNGSGLTARFKANERLRLSFIIHPSSSSSMNTPNLYSFRITVFLGR